MNKIGYKIWHNIRKSIGMNFRNTIHNIRENIFNNTFHNIDFSIGFNIRRNVDDNVWYNIRINIVDNIEYNIRENSFNYLTPPNKTLYLIQSQIKNQIYE